MGKKNNQDAEKQGEQCQSTVFVSNLPYSFTTPQLEETFSEVGPIRRCFMVTQKGSTEHRGFGFVQFAASEDADRAIEMKNGSAVGGRKVAVKHANPRASLQQRRAKANNVAQSSDTEVLKNKDTDVMKNEEDTEVRKNEKDGVAPENQKEAVKEVVKDHKQGKPNAPKKAKGLCMDLVDAENHSGKQRVARTVIIGGLLNADMAEDALSCAKEIDGVCSVKYPLPKEELDQLGLTQDGCKPEAAAVLYATVRSACATVAKLHRKVIKGGNIWARQLGGEGSKTQKWKLIVHNLHFKTTEEELRETFSTAGFVWDVSVPHNPETGLSKGFAFVKFTSKQDAERAIQKFNGQKHFKRTIAVDWAVSKKLYAITANSAVMSEEGKHADSAADSGSDSDDPSDNDDTEKVGEDSHGSDIDSDDSELVENKASDTADDFEEEAKIAQKVLQNLMTVSNKGTSSSEDHPNLPHKEPNSQKSADAPSKTTDGSRKKSSQSNPENTSESKVTKSKLTDDDEELQRTIFISNIPFEFDPEEVKQRFASFGEVKSFFPVLHKVTGRPRGTGFLKFSNADAVSAAVSAANVGPGLGIFLKGRQLTVLKALDKKSANDKAVEKSKTEVDDRRNLYLAKEGLILEGTPAAEGVSASDMQKRQGLERKKMIKLRSPNFHISKTRLIIYNLPKSMNVKELKKLLIDGVTSRAVKQNPVIRQIKFLKDTKQGKVVSKNHSRGVAFVEFTEHEHALVALRALNNNPETFGPEFRPIVEFALDNIQTMRQRNLKMQTQQQETIAADGDNADPSAQPHKKSMKMDDTKKRKPQNKKITRGIPNPTPNPNPSNEIEKESGPAYDREEDEATFKKQRTDSKKKNTQEKMKPKPIKEQTQKKFEQQEPKSLKKNTKRKVREEPADEKAKKGFVEKKRARTGKNKDPLGRDMGDKLDMLIEQYRSKFTQRSSEKANGERQVGGSKQIRRWFQT